MSHLRALQYKKTNHVGHFLLTVITGGFWILPWLVIWAVNQNHNSKVDQRYYELTHDRFHHNR